MTAYSETRRQILHIAMAGFAFLLRYLTWPQAAGLAVIALIFNAVVLAKVAPGIMRETDARGIRAGVLFYPLSILLLVLAFPRRLDIVAAAWGVMALGDGFATLAGNMTGAARLPWNTRKTWNGFFAFIIAGSVGGTLLSVWVAPTIDPAPHPLFTLWAPAVAAIVAGLVETLPIGLDDNLSVPAAAGSTLWFLSQLNWIGPVDRLIFDVAIGAVLGLVVALIAWRVRAISASGAIAGAMLATIIYAGLFLAGIAVLAVALFLTIVSTRMGAAAKVALRIQEMRQRGASNIVANCLIGSLGAVVELFSFDWGLELTGAWFVAGIAAGASDTVASEIGKVWGGTPRAVPSWRPMPPGTPGAVTPLGTIAGVAAATLITLPAVMMWLIPLLFVVPIVTACTVAAFLESALATRFEARGVLDNNTLNFLNTAAATTLAVWWCGRLNAC